MAEMRKYTPECPFCGIQIGRPVETKTEFGEVLSGHCACGAFYVCDPTGHNAGEAYMEALALMKGNWDIGSLDAESDYKTAEMDYDLKKHTPVYSMGGQAGKLIFVKASGSGAPDPAVSVKSADDVTGTGWTKGDIRRMLEAGPYDDILARVKKDKSLIRKLISLSYDKEDVISWKTMEVLGLAARELAAERMDVNRDTVRRLLWSMGEESGGIGWSSAEILGEMIRNCPDDLSDIIPIVWSFRDEEMFRAGTLRAMGRIASVRPDLVQFIIEDLPVMAGDSNPMVRGYAAWVMGILGDAALRGPLESLLKDTGVAAFYCKGILAEKSVAEIAQEALHKAPK